MGGPIDGLAGDLGKGGGRGIAEEDDQICAGIARARRDQPVKFEEGGGGGDFLRPAIEEVAISRAVA